MRRGRLGYLAVVVLSEQLFDHGHITPAVADVEHSADEKAHHMVKEAVRLDVERQAAFTLPPRRGRYGAVVVIVLGL